jgi:hypothetical protein
MYVWEIFWFLNFVQDKKRLVCERTNANLYIYIYIYTHIHLNTQAAANKLAMSGLMWCTPNVDFILENVDEGSALAGNVSQNGGPQTILDGVDELQV